jgi:hypothetical protein
MKDMAIRPPTRGQKIRRGILDFMLVNLFLWGTMVLLGLIEMIG